MKAWSVFVVAVIVLSVTKTTLCQTTQPTSRPVPVRGTLLKVEGNHLIIQARPRGDEDAREVTVTTDEQTVFMVDAELGGLEDLRPGMGINVRGMAGNQRRPGRLAVTAESAGVYGTIVRIDGTSIILLTPQQGGDRTEVIVTTDEATKIIFLAQVQAPGTENDSGYKTIEDLKPDMRVKVLPLTGTAVKIIVVPSRDETPPR